MTKINYLIAGLIMAQGKEALFFFSPFDILKTAGRTSSAMGCKTGKVLLLFLACAMAQMFLVLTHCTLQNVKLFPASGTRFQFSTCFCL